MSLKNSCDTRAEDGVTSAGHKPYIRNNVFTKLPVDFMSQHRAAHGQFMPQRGISYPHGHDSGYHMGPGALRCESLSHNGSPQVDSLPFVEPVLETIVLESQP